MQKILSGSLQSLLSASCEDRPHAQDLSELLFKAKSDVSLATTSHQSVVAAAAEQPPGSNSAATSPIGSATTERNQSTGEDGPENKVTGRRC